MMTVQELIESLQKLDPNLNVFIEGYESGYDNFIITDPDTFKLNQYKNWWNGPHQKDKNGEVKAIVLKGINRHK